MHTRARLSVAFVVTLLSLLVAVTASAQTYSWSVLAGQPPQFGAVDGPAASARFKSPSGIAGDAQGNLYVADTQNHTIRKIAPDGSVTTLAGKAGESGTADGLGASARFNSPHGVAVDGAGNVFVADRANHAVRKITPAGLVSTFAGRKGSLGAADGSATEAQFIFPQGLAFDHDGSLLVADLGSHTIRRISPAGSVETIAGAAGPGGYVDAVGRAARFSSPSDVAVDRTGNIFVADLANQVIRRIARDGRVTTVAGTVDAIGATDGTGAAARFNEPMGLAIDANDNLYVADQFNDAIRKITPEGVVTLFAGVRDARGSANGPAATAQFFTPADLHVEADGSLFVADAGNHTIRRISPAQVVSDHAGPGGNFGLVDATGTNARFNYPRGLAINGGRLYVADGRNNRIREVTTEGVVTSVLTGNFANVAYRGDTLVVSNPATHVVRIYTISTGRMLELARASFTGANIFNQPNGVAIDRQGRIYVADTANHMIRVIIVSATEININTVAGAQGQAGAADGKGTAARFNSPLGVAVDDADNVYVADTGSHTIRRIAPDGTVTTLAGAPGQPRQVDGEGAAARFRSPAGIAVDGQGNVFVADRGNHAVRRITPAGMVSTVGGSGSTAIHAVGLGTQAAFLEPNGIAVGADGVIYVVSSANNVIMKGAPGVQGGGQPPAGTPPSRIVNLSIRTTAGTGSNTLIVGLGVGGGGASGGKPILLRGVGPSLARFGVTGALGDPVLTLFRESTQTAQNDDWNGGFDFASVGAFALAGDTPRDAALHLPALAPASYTIQITGKNNATGLALAEIYDATPDANFTVTTPRLVNVSARTQVGTGENVLIAGVVVAGTQPMRVLVRAVGPTLGQFGVMGTLTDPKLEIYRDGAKVAENDNWGGTAELKAAFGAVAAFDFSGDNSRDAALIATLAPGSYTAQVTGVGGSTGVALVEVYELP